MHYSQKKTFLKLFCGCVTTVCKIVLYFNFVYNFSHLACAPLHSVAIVARAFLVAILRLHQIPLV